MTYSARQVSDALGPIVAVSDRTGEQMLGALAQVLPGVTIKEAESGLSLWSFEAEIADAEREAELTYLKKISTYMAGETDEGVTIGEVMQRHADAGDPWAKAQIDLWNSPDSRAHNALAAAAALAHDDWTLMEDGALRWRDGTDDSGGDVDALIDWFQINHPETAKAVEDRARA